MPTPDSSAIAFPLHVRFGDFEVDEANALLTSKGRSVALPPVPFGLLCALLRHSGTLLLKNALLDEVWGHRFVSDSVLKGAISDVRRVLGDDPRQPRYIETLPRRGYRFIAATVLLNNNRVAASHDAAVSEDTSSEVAGVETATSPLFVGRIGPLKRLHQAWERVLQGNKAIIWVAGEPGIGKTTLIEHFASGLKDVARVFGQCVQHHGSGEPYLPVFEALSELCKRDPAAASLLRDVAPTWLLQLPWLSTVAEREALLHELVGANPQRMLREMAEFVDRYTELHPLLLITEDLQWADESTIQLIDYMARRRSRQRFMWLSSFRLTEVIALDHPLNSIRHELRPAGLSDEILLDSFSETEVAAYIAARTPMMQSSESFVRTLHERTSGVPLFVASLASEVLDNIAQSGAADPASMAINTVPESLGSLIDHYVVRLSDERRKLLVAAAVSGMGLRTEILSLVLGWDEYQIADLCDELVRERVWLVAAKSDHEYDRAEYAYGFRHALYRQRLYDTMTASSRAELHQKIGIALEQQRAGGQSSAATELASHFDLGRVPLKALAYYAEAAQAALLHLSPAECMTLTERALKLASRAPASEERYSSELMLATLRGSAAFHTLGAGDEAKKAYQHAVELVKEFPKHPVAGLALYGLGFLLYLRAEYAEALAIAERTQALALAGHNPLLIISACILKGQVLMIQGQHANALDVLEQALPSLELTGAQNGQNPTGYIIDPAVTVRTLLGMVLSQLGRFNEANQHMQQAYTRSRDLAQPMALMSTIWCDALCWIRRGDTARVGALAREMQILVDEYSLAQGKAAYRWFLGWADARSGKPQEGACRIREAYDENRALGMVSGSSETLGYVAEALIIKGDWQQAQLQLEQAFEIVNSYGERIYLPQLLLIQAAIDHMRGDLNAETESLRLAITEAQQQGAAWLELLALTAWCERRVPTSKDLSALERLLSTLNGSDDANLMEQARSILRFAKNS